MSGEQVTESTDGSHRSSDSEFHAVDLAGLGEHMQQTVTTHGRS